MKNSNSQELLKDLKYILKIFIILLCLCSYSTKAQVNEKQIEKQIFELHRKTKKTQDSVGLLINDYNAKFEQINDSSDKAIINKKLTLLWKVFDDSLREQTLNDLNFAIRNPYSMKCLELLLNQMQLQQSVGYFKEFEKAYNNFSAEVRNSQQGQTMSVKLKYFLQSSVGSKAPEFKFNDIDGNEIKLSDYRGKKVILLEFWASWCAPCLQDQDYLKEIYKKFEAEDLEFISISRDTDIEKWKNTVFKQKVNIWKQACVVNRNSACGEETSEIKKLTENKKNQITHFNIVDLDQSIETSYFVSGIPHYVIIDKDGQIVGKWKNSGETNMIELENRLSEIFAR